MRPIIQQPQHTPYRKFFVLLAAFFLTLGLFRLTYSYQSELYNDSDVMPQVERALSTIEATYKTLRVPAMMSLLDKHYEVWLIFKSRLENYFLTMNEVQLRFIADTVLQGKGKISVRLHWFKSTVAKSGAFTKTQGTSQFVFTQNLSGLKLLYIRGDNPFY